MIKIITALALAFLATCTYYDDSLKESDAAKKTDSPKASKELQLVLNQHCLACHGEKEQEGEVRFDTLTKMNAGVRLDLFQKMQEQIQLEEMPPEEEKQPTAAERKLLLDWIEKELKAAGQASRLKEKMRSPDFGNYVNHEKLFSGKIKNKAYTPARRWLVSPQIFHERVIAVFKLTGRERQRSFYGVTNPIVLPDNSGVRYYDNSSLDGGHLLMMLTNVEWISQKQIRAARVKSGEFKSNELTNPKDRWYPRKTPEAFEKIILKKNKPTDEEIMEAINVQFDCVLQRKATDKEQKKYLKLTKATIKLAGNTEGLRQMLVSVLLESEFLYRLELGAGEPDTFGRKKLSPREASYAIAYALGDRNPDSTLVKAAKEGRLSTKEDYKREVLRLLNDNTTFYSEGAPNVNGKHLRSHKVTHQRSIGFSASFSATPTALKFSKILPAVEAFMIIQEEDIQGLLETLLMKQTE